MHFKEELKKLRKKVLVCYSPVGPQICLFSPNFRQPWRRSSPNLVFDRLPYSNTGIFATSNVWTACTHDFKWMALTTDPFLSLQNGQEDVRPSVQVIADRRFWSRQNLHLVPIFGWCLHHYLHFHHWYVYNIIYWTGCCRHLSADCSVFLRKLRQFRDDSTSRRFIFCVGCLKKLHFRLPTLTYDGRLIKNFL